MESRSFLSVLQPTTSTSELCTAKCAIASYVHTFKVLKIGTKFRLILVELFSGLLRLSISGILGDGGNHHHPKKSQKSLVPKPPFPSSYNRPFIFLSPLDHLMAWHL